jgi:hypothetical protein
MPIFWAIPQCWAYLAPIRIYYVPSLAYIHRPLRWGNKLTPIVPLIKTTRTRRKPSWRRKRNKKADKPVEMPEPSELQKYID